MTQQKVIAYWCDGDKRLIAKETGHYHDGPTIAAMIAAGPRTVTLPHDFLAPAELQAIALIECAPGNMGHTGGAKAVAA